GRARYIGARFRAAERQRLQPRSLSRRATHAAIDLPHRHQSRFRELWHRAARHPEMKVRRALGIVGTAAVAGCTGGATGVNAPTEQPASDSGTTFADANRTSDVAPPSRPKNDATNEFTPP